MYIMVKIISGILLLTIKYHLKAWHSQSLVNQKPLVVDEREWLGIQDNLRNYAHMGCLSSWVGVNPVHWRLGNVGQDLDKRKT